MIRHSRRYLIETVDGSCDAFASRSDRGTFARESFFEGAPSAGRPGIRPRYRCQPAHRPDVPLSKHHREAYLVVREYLSKIREFFGRKRHCWIARHDHPW